MPRTDTRTEIETKQYKVTVEINASGKLQVVIDDKRFDEKGITVIDKYQDDSKEGNILRVGTDATIRTSAPTVNMEV